MEMLPIFEALIEQDRFKFSGEEKQYLKTAFLYYNGYGENFAPNITEKVAGYVIKDNGRTKVKCSSKGRFSSLVSLLRGLKFSNSKKVAKVIATSGGLLSGVKLQKLSSETQTEVASAIYYLSFIAGVKKNFGLNIQRAVVAADLKFGNPYNYIKRAAEEGITEAENDIAEMGETGLKEITNPAYNAVADKIKELKSGVTIPLDGGSMLKLKVNDGFLSDLFNGCPHYLAADVIESLYMNAKNLSTLSHRFLWTGNVLIEPQMDSGFNVDFSGSNSYLTIGLSLKISGNISGKQESKPNTLSGSIMSCSDLNNIIDVLVDL
jgi:hypothetical protein